MVKISVVTIVYNDKEHICQTMDSVLSQTSRNNIEYIIIDGASTDGTSQQIQEIINEIDLYVCEPDSGIYDAMNKGLRNSSGDYVVFMNSGDLFSDSNVIKDVINTIGSLDKMPDLLYGNYREIKGGKYSSPIPARTYDKIWYGPVASHQSCFYNRKFLLSNKLEYDITYKVAADYKLTLNTIYLSDGNILKLDRCISDCDVSGVSNTNRDLGLAEANRARKEILGWGKIKECLLTMLLLCARYTKRFAYPLYKRLRNL